MIIFFFCSIHKMRVPIRTTSLRQILMDPTLSFGAKNNVYPLKMSFSTYCTKGLMACVCEGVSNLQICVSTVHKNLALIFSFST